MADPNRPLYLSFREIDRVMAPHSDTSDNQPVFGTSSDHLKDHRRGPFYQGLRHNDRLQ